jgi:hypothetical protein
MIEAKRSSVRFPARAKIVFRSFVDTDPTPRSVSEI